MHNLNTKIKCPACGSDTYETQADGYHNIWCIDPNFECEWFTEVDDSQI